MENLKIGKDIQKGRIVGAFSYNPKFVAQIKSIEGHRWYLDKVVHK